MEKKMNNIEKEIDDLFSFLKKSDCYNNYLSAKKQLENSKYVSNIIKEIKRLQKIGTNNSDKYVEKRIKQLYEELNNIPLYVTYVNYKEELNDELANIKYIFDKYFEEVLKL